MTQSSSRSVLTIKLAGPLRGILVLPVILVLIGSWFVVHWYLGDTIAEYAPEVEGNGSELAQLAVKWAPNDPFAHFMLGDLEQKELSLTQLADAVREYEIAVRLAPNDYRYWMQLGRALEASGDVDGGEKALRRAHELAPSYSYPRWYLGNLLLREGKQDEAFREFVQASQADSGLLPQVFSLSWELFGGNADQIATIACPNTDARAQLAIYLVNRNEADSAIRIWESLSSEDRKDLRDVAETLKKSLFDSGHFHYVLEIMRDLETDTNSLPQPEKFFNAGFEKDTSSRTAGKFGWSIDTSVQAQISVDHSQWHNGRGSLKIIFKSPGNLDTINVSQIVVVEPDTQYRFECYARTQDLRSGGTPVIAILDAENKTLLARSTPLPDGTNEWQPVTFEFRTKRRMEGITVTLGRASCGSDPLCPIFGTVWYDDFSLQRYNGPPTAGNDAAGGTRSRSATVPR